MKGFSKIFLFLLVLFALDLFDVQFLNKTVIRYSVYLFLLGTFFLSLPHVLSRRGGFVLPVQLILFSVVFSVIMANYSWGQSFKDSFFEIVPYLTWVAFFYLLHLKVPVDTIERVVLFFGSLYVVLYFYQFAHSPTVLFGKSLYGEEFTEDRGITRIIFPGAGIFILAVFISITKITTGARKKWFWMLYAGLGIIIPVLQVTRQFIVGILVIYGIHFFKRFSIVQRVFLLASLVLIGWYIAALDNPVLQGLSEAAEDDLKKGGNYIRVLAGKYFLLDFSPDLLTRIFGNGAPYWGISSYGAFIENLAEAQGYYISDVGIIGMYAMFGVPAVIGYLMIWYKSFTCPLPPEFKYLKYYLWYLLFTSLTWFTVYHYHYLISTVLVLYVYQTVLQRDYALAGRPYYKGGPLIGPQVTT